jgi:hypothetical protein
LISRFPFAGHLQRLGRLLLHRFRLVQQRQLVKFLNVYLQRGKRGISSDSRINGMEMALNLK